MLNIYLLEALPASPEPRPTAVTHLSQSAEHAEQKILVYF